MERLFLWGTGHEAGIVMSNCMSLDCYEILGFIDNDPAKEGQSFYGRLIYSPRVLKSLSVDKIVILTDKYNEVQDQIVREYPQYKGRVENKNYFYKNTLLMRYSVNDDPEIQEILDYIDTNGLYVFNYPFREKYLNAGVDVFWDEREGFFYVYHCGKKMYFPSRYSSKEKVIEYYRTILMEQDEKSPHRYLDYSFNVEEGDVVVDAGAAEGNFSLEIIDRVKHIYLIEADNEWADALKATFAPFMNKVTIINKYLTDYDEGEMASLDKIVTEPVNFIKMDIEGSEYDALCGARKVISESGDLKLAICCYHSDFDEILIEKYMDDNGIYHEVTRGYMWFPFLFRQTWVSTKLNRAIVRGYHE